MLFIISKMLTGLESMTSGEIEVMGLTYPKEWNRIQTLIGLCPQHGILYPDLTPREHLIFYGELKGVQTGEELEASVDEWVEKRSYILPVFLRNYLP